MCCVGFVSAKVLPTSDKAVFLSLTVSFFSAWDIDRAIVVTDDEGEDDDPDEMHVDDDLQLVLEKSLNEMTLDGNSRRVSVVRVVFSKGDNRVMIRSN